MKKKKKNLFAQIMAWLALFAIVIWIVGTWILVLFSSGQSSNDVEQSQTLSQEELQRIIDQSSIEVNADPVELAPEGDTEIEISTSTWEVQ